MAELIRFADRAPVPWKNGTGTTRELWKRVDASGAISARISAAEISGQQAFSNFAGYDRVILQLAGPQVMLDIDGCEMPMLPSAPIGFRGEAQVSSRVDGRALDLNLMCLRTIFRPKMRVIEAAQEQPLRATGTCAVLTLAPVDAAGAVAASLQLHDLVVLERGETVNFKQAARLVVMDIQSVAGA